AVGDDDHTGVQTVADADTAAVVDAHPAGAAGRVDERIGIGQSAMASDRVRGRINFPLSAGSDPNGATRNPMPELIDVDPGELHLPPSRAQGAAPYKLARQIAKHGDSLDGMPPLQVVRGKDGHLRINDGVTRATRAAQLHPGTLVPAEVIQDLPQLDVTKTPKVKDTLP